MFTKDQVNQLKELFAQQRKEIQGDIQKDIKSSEETLRSEIKMSIKASEETLRSEIRASEERVTRTIKTEVADLSEVINKLVEGHEDHRLRIEELEESVGVTIKH